MNQVHVGSMLHDCFVFVDCKTTTLTMSDGTSSFKTGKLNQTMVADCEVLWRAQKRGHVMIGSNFEEAKTASKAFLLEQYIQMLEQNSDTLTEFELRSLKGQCLSYCSKNKGSLSNDLTTYTKASSQATKMIQDRFGK